MVEGSYPNAPIWHRFRIQDQYAGLVAVKLCWLKWHRVSI